jgi:MFS family permease
VHAESHFIATFPYMPGKFISNGNGCAAVMGVLWIYTGLIFPSFKGLALGIIVTFGYSAASFAPIAIGYIGDLYAVSTALWSVCVPTAFLAGVSFFASYFIRRTKKDY